MPRPPLRLPASAPFARVVPAAALALTVACTGDRGGNEARGPGLKAASLSPAAEAAVYEATAGAAFDLGPGLSLLLDPQRLPRGEGFVGGDRVPPEVLKAAEARGLVRGTCEPPRAGSRAVPVCRAALPGYVLRFSDVLRLAGDSVEVYLVATRYRTTANEPAEALMFERAYQLRGAGERWRVLREARIPQRQR